MSEFEFNADGWVPDVIIGGAPKCGTSSVYRWLADHPGTCASKPKEPFFLMDPEHPLGNEDGTIHDQGLEGYRRFFYDLATSEETVAFEATTHYLYQKTAPRVLGELDDPPQVVFILREPAERTYSSFRYTKNNLGQFKRDVTFGEYVDALIDGRRGEMRGWFRDPDEAYVNVRHLEYGRYREYLADWYEQIGREKVSVFLFEEMVEDNRRWAEKFATEIGLRSEFYESYEFPRENPTREIERPALHRFVRSISRRFPSGSAKSFVKRVYLSFQERSDSLKSKSEERDRRALDRLRKYYEPFNRQLEEFLGVDLARWREGDSA